MKRVELFKAIAASLFVLGAVMGLFNLLYAPSSLFLRVQHADPGGSPWLSWVLPVASTLAFIILSYYRPAKDRQIIAETQTQSNQLYDLAAIQTETNKHLKQIVSLLENAERNRNPSKLLHGRPARLFLIWLLSRWSHR